MSKSRTTSVYESGRVCVWMSATMSVCVCVGGVTTSLPMGDFHNVCVCVSVGMLVCARATICVCVVLCMRECEDDKECECGKDKPTCRA